MKLWTDCTAQEIADWADETGHGKGMDGQLFAVSALFPVIEHLAGKGRRDLGHDALSLLCAKYNRINAR